MIFQTFRYLSRHISILISRNAKRIQGLFADQGKAIAVIGYMLTLSGEYLSH